VISAVKELLKLAHAFAKIIRKITHLFIVFSAAFKPFCVSSPVWVKVARCCPAVSD